MPFILWGFLIAIVTVFIIGIIALANITLRLVFDPNYIGMFLPYDVWKHIYTYTQEFWSLKFFSPQFYEYSDIGTQVKDVKISAVPVSSAELNQLFGEFCIPWRVHVYFKNPFAWFHYFHDRFWGIIGVRHEITCSYENLVHSIAISLSELQRHNQFSKLPIDSPYSCYHGVYCMLKQAFMSAIKK